MPESQDQGIRSVIAKIEDAFVGQVDYAIWWHIVNGPVQLSHQLFTLCRESYRAVRGPLREWFARLDEPTYVEHQSDDWWDAKEPLRAGTDGLLRGLADTREGLRIRVFEHRYATRYVVMFSLEPTDTAIARSWVRQGNVRFGVSRVPHAGRLSARRAVTVSDAISFAISRW